MNGSILGTTSNRYITSCIDWQVISQDTASNTSVVEAVLFYRKSSSSTAATYGIISGYLNVHDFGAWYSQRVRLEPNDGWVEVCRCTRTVEHAADGSLTITLSASGAISGTTLNSTSVSDSVRLPDIPRASVPTLSAAQVEFGQSITVYTHRASTAFTHHLYYSLNGGQETGIAPNIGDSYTWTVPAELMRRLPNAASASLTFRLYTFSGTQNIGSRTVTCTVCVPASVVPSLTGISISEAADGVAEQFGAYVQSKSALTVSTSAAGAYGAVIAQYTVAVDGRTYSGSKITTETLTSAGAVPVTVTVTDSRGRTASRKETVTVLAYAPPAITALTVHRCDAKGGLDEGGDYVSIRYAYAVSELGGRNTHAAQFDYKRHKAMAGDWTELGSDDAFRADATLVPETELVTDYRWDIRLTVSDYFGSTEMTALLPSAEVILDLLATGDGMGIGKTAETRGAVELAWQLVADIPLLDQAVENIADLSTRTATIENAYITTERVSTLLAGKADVDDLTAYQAEVGKLLADKAEIKELDAVKADVKDLSAVRGQVDDLTTRTSTIEKAYISEAKVEELLADKADVSDLHAASARVDALEAGKADIKDLTAATARVDQLDADKLSVADAEVKYANIDFSNIGKAAIEQFYATSGIIKNLVIGDTTITGELVGVTIRGDLIEGGTVVADKLVIRGEDGLYYKLNTDGVTTEAQQTDYNSLSGQIIRAKSITASKIAVDDLVAFGATIGGFRITTDALYSGVKESADNTTRGVYLDSSGQLSVGDSKSYLRYYKGTDGKWKLEIAASSMALSTGQSVEDALEEVWGKIDGIQVGGRNLLRGSKALKNDRKDFYSCAVTVNDKYGDFTAVKTDCAWQGPAWDISAVMERCALNPGDTVTYSVMAMVDFVPDKPCTFSLYRAATAAMVVCTITMEKGKWYKISKTFTLDEGSATAVRTRLETNYYKTIGNLETENRYDFEDGYMYFAAPKLELGTIPTDWTPAPEDADSALSDVKADLDTVRDEVSSILRIDSSRGTVFKNNQVTTVLTVTIFRGSQQITDLAGLRKAYGDSAYLQWKWQRLDEDSFGLMSAGDSRFSNDGFALTLSPEDVDTKITFRCEIITN